MDTGAAEAGVAPICLMPAIEAVAARESSSRRVIDTVYCNDKITVLELPPFYPILDSQLVARAGLSPVLAAEAILQAGARILQFRHKGHFSREQWESAARIADLCREAGALFVINDRADIAALLGAALHL